ncbi:outer membrane protein assembly factor [candidate division KSB1 bacterium]
MPAFAQEYYVESVSVKGNSYFSSNRLLSMLEMKASDLYDIEILSQDMKAVLDIYRVNGFYFAEIDTVLMNSVEEGKRFELIIHVNEGLQFLFGSFDVAPGSVLSAGDFNSFLPKRGTVFTHEALEQSLGELVDEYEDRGYPYVIIEVSDMTYRYNEERNVVDVNVHLKIRNDRKVTIDSLVVKGNEYTRSEVIIRESRLKPGDTYKKAFFEKAQEYVQNLAYIDETAEPALYTFDRTRSLVQLSVRENKANSLNGIVGYIPGNVNKNGYYIGAFHVNLGNILGTGRIFQASWDKQDETSQQLNAYYEEPWVAGFPVNMFGMFEQSLQDSSYIKRSLLLGITFDLNSNIKSELSFGIERVFADEQAARDFVVTSSGGRFFTIGVSYRNMDYRINPRRGIYYSTRITEQTRKLHDVASDSGLRDFKDRKINMLIEAAAPVTRSLVVFTKGAWNQTSNSQRDVPVTQQWYLGGATSLRGYREKQFLASRVSWYNLELRYLINRYSRLFLFQDGGFFQNDGEQVNQKFGYGFGMRIRSRLGLIGFDIGLGENDNFSSAKLHVHLENRF